MMIINGNVFNGNNLIIVNGRVVSGDNEGKSKKFDERKQVEARNVDRLVIDTTFVNVSIMTATSSYVEAHLYGEAVVDGKVELQAELYERDYRISVKSRGNVYNGRLKLDILVPNKAFNSIEVQTESADMNLARGVCGKYVELNSKSGDMELQAEFTKASVSTMSGDIKVNVNAKEDIELSTKTMSGDIDINLSNIARANVSTKTMSGDARNYYQSEKKGYRAQIKASSMSGDITIR